MKKTQQKYKQLLAQRESSSTNKQKQKDKDKGFWMKVQILVLAVLFILAIGGAIFAWKMNYNTGRRKKRTWIEDLMKEMVKVERRNESINQQIGFLPSFLLSVLAWTSDWLFE